MRRMKPLLGCVCLLLSMALFAEPVTPTQTVALVPAKDLSAFTTWIEGHGFDSDPDKVFSIVDDGAVRASGKSKGMLTTKKAYANYHLYVEYKWGDKHKNIAGDSGIFCHTLQRTEKPAKGTLWGLSTIELQLATKMKQNKSGDVLLLGRASKPPTMVVNGKKRKAFAKFGIKEDHEKPVGEWNTLEAIFDGGRVTVKVNGKQTFTGTDSSPAAGRVFIQSNSGEITFRRVELRPLK